MILGILSDTHDRAKRTSRAIAALVDGGAEALVHCGDLTGPEIVFHCGRLPCHFVFGNNDYNERSLVRAIEEVGGINLGFGGAFELGGRRIAVTHGHLQREIDRAIESRPDYLLMGHTHTAYDERVGPTRLINPGALHRASNYSVALLDLVKDELSFLQIDPRD